MFKNHWFLCFPSSRNRFTHFTGKNRAITCIAYHFGTYFPPWFNLILCCWADTICLQFWALHFLPSCYLLGPVHLSARNSGNNYRPWHVYFTLTYIVIVCTLCMLCFIAEKFHIVLKNGKSSNVAHTINSFCIAFAIEQRIILNMRTHSVNSSN